jgi:prepilin-type N-terminal cleavage/methylation domain-containing protein
MEILRSHRHKAGRARGFTMIETLVAMLVLTVGLVTLGSLASQTLNGTSRSRFAGLAANLASEKLEDLNRWPTWDPNVYAAGGSTAGSLTTDTSGSVTSNGITENVDYYDDVEISDGNGAVSETVKQLVGGVLKYVTTTHNPDGTMVVTNNTTASTADTNVVSFHRRWIIEKDQPISGLRRITVLVNLSNGFMDPPVSFQTSMVRQ